MLRRDQLRKVKIAVQKLKSGKSPECKGLSVEIGKEEEDIIH